MAVVLGDPEAVVAQLLAILRERDGVPDRLAVRAIEDGDRLVKDGETQRSISLAGFRPFRLTLLRNRVWSRGVTGGGLTLLETY
jgi:hypothetical protein